MRLQFAMLVAGCLPLLARGGEPEDFFEKKIRPVLDEHCYKCHSDEARLKGKLKGGLLLDSKEGTRDGGDSGPAVVPGKPGEGTLLAALKYGGDTKMPPPGKLPDEVVKDFEKWIGDGAVDPRVAAAPRPAPTATDLAEAKKPWSFQRPKPRPAPPVKDAKWPAKPIDFFVLGKLESAGILPAPPAEARALFRRLSFDLTGLPPSPEAVEAFVADPSP